MKLDKFNEYIYNLTRYICKGDEKLYNKFINNYNKFIKLLKNNTDKIKRTYKISNKNYLVCKQFYYKFDYDFDNIENFITVEFSTNNINYEIRYEITIEEIWYVYKYYKLYINKIEMFKYGHNHYEKTINFNNSPDLKTVIDYYYIPQCNYTRTIIIESDINNFSKIKLYNYNYNLYKINITNDKSYYIFNIYYINYYVFILNKSYNNYYSKFNFIYKIYNIIYN